MGAEVRQRNVSPPVTQIAAAWGAEELRAAGVRSHSSLLSGCNCSYAQLYPVVNTTSLGPNKRLLPCVEQKEAVQLVPLFSGWNLFVCHPVMAARADVGFLCLPVCMHSF